MEGKRVGRQLGNHSPRLAGIAGAVVSLGTYLLQVIRLWGRMTCFGQADVDWMIGQGAGWTLQVVAVL